MVDLPAIGEEVYGTGFLEWLKVGRHDDGTLIGTHNRVLNLVDDYGCDPLGLVPCSDAIMQAYADAIALGGALIYGPRGIYLLDKTVDVQAPTGGHAHQYVTLAGAGWGATQFVPASDNLTMFRIRSDTLTPFTHFFRFQDLALDAKNIGGLGILCDYVSHFQCIGVTFLNFPANVQGAMRWRNVAWGQVFFNNFVDLDSNTTCLSIEETSFGSLIAANIFGPRTSSCVYMGPANEGNMLMLNHFAFSKDGTQVYLQGFELTVEANYIYPSKDLSPTPQYLPLAGQAGIVLDGCFQTLIKGNFIEDVEDAPSIEIKGGANRCIIRNNFFAENGEFPPATGAVLATGEGCITVRADASTGIVIGENTFDDNWIDHHIKVEKAATEPTRTIDIMGNVFVDAPNGLKSNGGATKGADIELEDPATDTGIRLARHYSPALGYFVERMIGGAANLTGATPNVALLTHAAMINGAPTNVTDLLGGHVTQVVDIVFGTANQTIKFSTSATLVGNEGQDWTPDAGDSMRATYNGSTWSCYPCKGGMT